MPTAPVSRIVAPSTLSHGAGTPRTPGRGWWGGQRVLAFAIGSGGAALGVALLAVASERMQHGASFFSGAAMVGAGSLIGSLMLLVKGARG